MKFSKKDRMLSFKFAFRGIARMIGNEHNAWIHLVVTVVVIVFGLWVNLSAQEWIFIVIAIGLVWMAEAFNTAIEHLANSITKEINPNIKLAKDVAAGAVLFAAIVAAVIGLIVLLPHLLEKLN